MTAQEIAGLIAYVNSRWSRQPVGKDALPTWREDLGPVSAEEAHAAVVEWAQAGNSFPPTSGQIRAGVNAARQGPPPSGDAAQRWLAKMTGKRTATGQWVIPYGSYTPTDTAAAIANLSEQPGAHEAVLRWVARSGLEALMLRMPDPELGPLDPNQLADRRDKLRFYESAVVSDWKADPTPGIALKRAVEAAGALPGGDGLRTLDTGRAVRELASGEAEGAPTPEEVSGYVATAKANLARANAERESQRMRIEAERREEEAEMRRAEAELREHAERRRKEAS